jgi:hypothetical protein
VETPSHVVQLHNGPAATPDHVVHLHDRPTETPDHVVHLHDQPANPSPDYPVGEISPGYNANPPPEPDADQRLLTTSSRRTADANESQPVIRVSIGRIEVRATTSPVAPATKRASSTAPALSLSDYLKRRKGGTG